MVSFEWVANHMATIEAHSTTRQSELTACPPWAATALALTSKQQATDAPESVTREHPHLTCCRASMTTQDPLVHHTQSKALKPSISPMADACKRTILGARIQLKYHNQHG
jgi:hypothetical protein